MTTFHVLDTDSTVLNQQLTALIKQAPKLFQHAPIVLDMQKLKNPDEPLDLQNLITQLREKGLIPIGLRHGTPIHKKAATEAGLALLPDSKAEPMETGKSKSAESKIAKVITQPVRSGQQIKAINSDLIILSPVSPGAELMADGHIHVYGPLRGRALAGLSGNKDARIFCQSLEAELISIAGHYWVNEDIKACSPGQPVQIALDNDKLKITTL